MMGATARELGYRKPYLSELTDPRINLFLTGLLLRRLLTSRRGSLDEALQAYNGGLGAIGSGQTVGYARDVLSRYEALSRAHGGA